MIINHGHTTPTNGKRLFPLGLLIGALLIASCSPAAIIPITGGSSAGDNNSPTSVSAPAANATTAPLANQSNPNPKCDALFLANYDMGMALAVMVNLTPATDYSAYTTPGSPFYLDFTKLRSELDTLATLPDPSAQDALIVGKPSAAIVYFHQLLDLAEADIKNQGKPFVDTNSSGVKLIGIDTAWQQNAAVFGVAMGNVCKDYTAPADLFAGTPVATVDPQSGLINDSSMATMAAASANMEATLNAGATTYPDATDTPTP
jgi:hypothetical protein